MTVVLDSRGAVVRDDRQKCLAGENKAGASSPESTGKPARNRPNMTFPSQRFYLGSRDQSLSMTFVVAVGSGICSFTKRRASIPPAHNASNRVGGVGRVDRIYITTDDSMDRTVVRRRKQYRRDLR